VRDANSTVFIRIMDRVGKLGQFKAFTGYRLSAQAIER
jgi:hypothetical protein